MVRYTLPAILILSALLMTPALAQVSTMQTQTAGPQIVGGATMYPNKNIIENASNSKDHTTLVAAVKAANLVDVLQGPGPFTVFAPTNDAFAKLPSDIGQGLMLPQNKAQLTSILIYHVVPERITTADLEAKYKETGEVVYKTIQGGTILITKDGEGNWWVVDGSMDNVAKITISNVMQENGVIHVIDNVLMPMVIAEP